MYMKESRKSIFNWNHISDELTEEQVEELRANVTKNQVKFEFRGRTRKIDFSLFLPTYSP